MAGYYDYVLGLIPLSLLGVTLLLGGLGWSLTAAVPVGATGSVALIGHALFVNGPTDAVAADGPVPDANAGQPHPTAD
ncbi:MAG: hypothetical protein ABEJ61_01125 [Haloferacaceae archaeon]